MSYCTATSVRGLLRDLTNAVVNTDAEAAVNPKLISIESAIKRSDAEIDSRLLTRYSTYIPFNPVPALIMEISMHIAASRILKEMHPERIEADAGASNAYYSWASDQLNRLAAFKSGLAEIDQVSSIIDTQVALGNADSTAVFGYGDELTWGS